MRAGLAFWAGVLGAIVMSIGMWVAYGAGTTGFSFAWWWGSMILGNTSNAAWILGFVIHLILGGLIGLAYAAVFEAIGRSNWALGLLGGFIQLIIGGFVLGWISDVHPAIPQVIRHPGFFTSYWGWPSTLTFGVLTLVFGIIVGSMYDPIHKKRLVPSEKERRRAAEELPVGAAHERPGREEIYVPPTPEERIPVQRPPIQPGRRR